ncbi:hypothetical protein [Paraburkholderia tropica]|uniref:hypothetical protein n=1 Tax=Paraburkholderia tropica TaxID=92647 RepID=UPI002AB7D55B|nr:hypothetical protein [Paraburkholderia tropica]
MDSMMPKLPESKPLDILVRGLRAFPIKISYSELSARAAAGDPTVRKVVDGDEITFELVFTDSQAADLKAAFLDAHPQKGRYGLDEDAEAFVSLIGRYANAIVTQGVAEPDGQKERRRNIESFAKAFERMEETLGKLDSAALGYLYAKMADKFAANGLELSPSDGRVVSMLAHPTLSMVEAGELREQLRKMAFLATEAARDAAQSLPLHDNEGDRFEWKSAAAVQRTLVESGISFVPTETSFAAVTLRALLGLAGVEHDQVSHWLKKAGDHWFAHSQAFVDAVNSRNKSDG